jgi:NhaP-type Na+/H+ or K+/H+ antiporter/Trk K+ transport system NAD-binding subunit
MDAFLDNPGLTVAIALAAGIVAQSLARHIRLPGIVLLIAAGILLGPDVLGVVQPDSLGVSLHILVGFAIAVILFEGGLNLEWKRLKREARTIQLLISLGAVVTALGGSLAARFVLGWDWRLSILFGCLVIVTGPTVVTPLLRRIKVQRNLETVLEAEGVLIDAVGAVVAVLALEILLSPTGESLQQGMIDLPLHLLAGTLFGVLGGAVIAILLRYRAVVPQGLENVFTLALVLALFQGSNALVPETGIVSTVVAGLVVGNIRTAVQRDLKEFKEQITIMLIGMLFILLAADVRHSEAIQLGMGGAVVVAILMFLVRPANILVCTVGSGMHWREKAFLSWIAPRGVVAVTVATLFDERLTAAGITGGQDMRALVFLVIVATVLFQGITAPFAASMLGVLRPSGQGYVLLGSTPISRLLASILKGAGEEVVLIDDNAHACREAEEEGLRVVYGNALGERVLMSAELETRKAAVALLPNEAINMLFAGKAKEELKVPKTYVALQHGDGGISPATIHEAGAALLFGREVDLEYWSDQIRRGVTQTELWRCEEEPDDTTEKRPPLTRLLEHHEKDLLPLAAKRNGNLILIDDRLKLRRGDALICLLVSDKAPEMKDRLSKMGWRCLN